MSVLVIACVSECVSEFVRAASPHIWAYEREGSQKQRAEQRATYLGHSIYGQEVSLKRSLRRSAPELG